MPDRNVTRKADRRINCEMKKTRLRLLSYLVALVMGIILFATFWKWLFSSASSAVVTSGIVGVAIAVVLFLVWNEFKKPKDDGR